MFPKKLSRITKHKTPRYQLYQPGFNNINSCWLDGKWVTMPKDEWKQKKTAHQKMYAKVNKWAAKQHHADSGTLVKNMTDAQRQAYEFYSGTGCLKCMTEHPGGSYIHSVSVDLQGESGINPQSIAWLKKEGYKVLRKVRLGDKVTNQAKEYNIPEDLFTDESGKDGEPIDWQAKVVEQNMQRKEDMFFSCWDAATKSDESEQMRGFAVMTMMGIFMMQEETIIRAEWDAQREKPVQYTDLPRERKRYAKMRAQLETADNWEERYLESKKSHNECARANLDNSDGHLYCFVLPKFNSDGSHEPWGDKDVPWGTNENR
jgi:hypothetical protein